MRMETLELGALWQEFHELHQGLGERHGVWMELQDAGRPLHAIADRDRLLQAWLNLTRNACEAAPPGSTVTWSLAERLGGTLELTVHNAGPLIPPDLLPHLTQPFFTTKSGGTGLGLAIVRRLVEAHGGELIIHSDADTGTRISICLPRVDV
jgi:signal transduction histidine kinase